MLTNQLLTCSSLMFALSASACSNIFLLSMGLHVHYHTQCVVVAHLQHPSGNRAHACQPKHTGMHSLRNEDPFLFFGGVRIVPVSAEPFLHHLRNIMDVRDCTSQNECRQRIKTLKSVYNFAHAYTLCLPRRWTWADWPCDVC